MQAEIVKHNCVLDTVKLSDEKYKNIEQSLPATPACYPAKRVVMRTHSIAQRISSLNWENAHVSQLPNRVFMAMVDNDACTGSITKNPFNFKHFSSSQVAIVLDGEMPASLLKLSSVCHGEPQEWKRNGTLQANV